jgi:hypothetical protein
MIAESDGLTRATWLLTYATFGLVLTGIGAIIFAWVQLGRERSQRRVENLERQLEMFESDRFRKVRAKLGRDRLKGDSLKDFDPSDPPVGCYELLDFFEHVALLARQKNLSSFGTWHSFGPWIGPVWSDFREVIAIEQVNNKTTYCDFSWLVEEIKKIERKEGGDFLEYGTEELEGHYSYERALTENDVPRSRPRLKRRGKKASAATPSLPPPSLPN